MDESRVGVERALEALARALSDVGVAPMRAPSDTSVIEPIESSVAPLRLPGEIRRLWELIDPTTVAVHAHPGLMTSEFALQTWTQHVTDIPGLVPRVLFPIAYESWSHLF